MDWCTDKTRNLRMSPGWITVIQRKINLVCSQALNTLVTRTQQSIAKDFKGIRKYTIYEIEKLVAALECSIKSVSTETQVTAHLASATPLLPLWFYAAEREIQSPSRAGEEVLAAGRAGRFLRNQSTIVAISFPSQQNEEICSFFCNQWQMNRPERTKGGLCYQGLYLWKLLGSKMFYYFTMDFCPCNVIFGRVWIQRHYWCSFFKNQLPSC